ncbi:hypothetical protein O1611_g4893 [Lasiodiplodia mahajangana]|uniref:Uncharacterized protein n=1 Tax=Lasiodiplodia mahajangana TaxID=1108764 RepID=A0ACC2JMU4_9PEZI|nr:hypothetical protein O1611_g4893 [Lasiodiplodia mahajangana]
MHPVSYNVPSDGNSEEPLNKEVLIISEPSQPSGNRVVVYNFIPSGPGVKSAAYGKPLERGQRSQIANSVTNSRVCYRGPVLRVHWPFEPPKREAPSPDCSTCLPTECSWQPVKEPIVTQQRLSAFLFYQPQAVTEARFRTAATIATVPFLGTCERFRFLWLWPIAQQHNQVLGPEPWGLDVY